MKKALTKNIGLKIISLLVAVLFWLVVVNIDDPEIMNTISGIPVTVLDEDAITSQNQVYYIKSGDTASIIVKGPRSVIDKLSKDDFVAEAPLSEKSNVDAVPIYVRLRNSKHEKSVDITQKTMTMKLDIENIVTKNYDIQLNKTSEELAGYSAGKLSLTPATVTVSAPESIINIIARAAVDVDLSGHTEDFSEEVSIKFYTETGSTIDLGESTSISNATTVLSGSIYTIKEVPLKFGTIGTVADDYELVELIGDKQSIKISGPKADAIECINFPDELINVAGATSDVIATLDVGAQLPAGVTIVDEDSDMLVNVTAKIEPLMSKTYKLISSEIDIRNIPDNCKAKIDDKSVSFVLKGLQKNQDSFLLDNAEAYIDLKNAAVGTDEVVVKLNIPDGLQLIDKVTVKVTLSEKEKDKETTSQDTSEQTTTQDEQEKTTKDSSTQDETSDLTTESSIGETVTIGVEETTTEETVEE